MTADPHTQRKPKAAQSRLSGERLSNLVDAAGAGDQCAWNRLVAEFGSMIWAIARAHRLGDADAADVSQATWLALFQNLGRLNDPERVGAWIATTARRECLRILRDSQRRIPFGDDVPEQESNEPWVGEALLTRERDQELQRCFARLRPTDQALLRLLTADPQPAYEEISAALEMPIGSIGPTRQRALQRLRELLASQQTLSLMTE
ncbi:MAG TPA: sigma-70 family RNA polymerase sigma factor [Solirubrobacteraceae bacterium]|nr:sigma-70 family RNA polymerase sigma factor [Solirubrobacteraceae bacterium]